MMDSFFQPQPNVASRMLNQWLDRLLKIVIRTVVVIGTPLLATNAVNFYNNGWIIGLFAITVAYVIIFIIAFLPRVPYRVRAHALIWVTYAMTLVSLATFGLSGDGRVWIIFTTLFGTLFFGLPFGVFMTALNLLTFSLFGAGMTTGFIPVPSTEVLANSGTEIGWITTGTMMLFVLAASTLSVGYLVNFLHKSLEDRVHVNEQLRVLTRRLISIQEGERQDLARELHDDTLNSLALFTLDLLEDTPKKEISEKIQRLAKSLRHTINGLRPPSLDLGLAVSIEQLVDNLEERLQNQDCDTIITLDIKSEPLQFNPKIEQHLYRIIQQACENAILHAQAKTIKIKCEITKEKVVLQVVDDGIGFSSHPKDDLVYLISNQHFGLVTMMERADVIGAAFHINSNPGQGTMIDVEWKPNAEFIQQDLLDTSINLQL